jgi:HrpA-like RNA helicase
MLLEAATQRGEHCKMFVSQPRRIAVHGLLQRLRPMLGDKVGMRMGHNVRDDSEHTVICFVTTGYLVQLLAHAPHALLQHTHLIIDEVHERSIDGDVICWLAKRVMDLFPKLKLILMSATMTTGLYREYFRSYDEVEQDVPCVFVGARRFPVTIEVSIENNDIYFIHFEVLISVWNAMKFRMRVM